MAGLFTFNAASFKVTFGPILLTDFADDVISLKPMGDGITSMAGAGGSVSRSIITDPRFEVTLYIQQGSPVNDALSQYLGGDMAAGNMTQPFMAMDMGGRFAFEASQSWIENMPEVTFSKESTAFEWTIIALMDRYNLGGSNLAIVR